MSEKPELRQLHVLINELQENLEKKSIAIQRIWKERDELRAENETLRADAERLDWCISVLFSRGWLTTHVGCGCCGEALEFSAGTTGREAIDAARSKT